MPLGRMRLFEYAARHTVFAAAVDWAVGLGDASAVVRYHVLQVLPREVALADDVQAKLRADADEAVRLLASKRFGPGR